MPQLLDRVLQALTDAPKMPFTEAPDETGYWWAAWLDDAGAAELSAITPEPVRPGIVTLGECKTQSLKRHLAHAEIGSLSLLKSLAALFRESWNLQATNRGSKLREPGRQRLLDWTSDHVTATWTQAHPDVTFREVLAAVDPPLRLEGWGPERTPVRRRISGQRARFDAQA